MASSFENTIQLLYVETNTPKQRDYFDQHNCKKTADNLLSIIVAVSNSPASLGFPPGATADRRKEMIKDVVLLLLRLVNIPSDTLRGLLALKTSTEYLINKVLGRLIETSDDDILLFTNIMKDFYTAITLVSAPVDLKLYNDRPMIKDSPLANFHFEANSYADPSYDIELTKVPKSASRVFPLYEIYGYLLHQYIRINESHDLDPSTHEGYIRSARFFFKYLPIAFKKRRQHPPLISDHYIDAAFKQYDFLKTTDAIIDTDTATDHKNRLKRLIEGWEGIPKPHLGAIPRDEHTPIDGTPEISDKDDQDYINCGVAVENYMGEYEYSPDIDLDYIYLDPDRMLLEKKPNLTRNKSDFINLRSFHYTWDSNCMNLFHYSALYQFMAPLWLASNYGSKRQLSKNRNIIVYLLLLMHTGIASKKLLNLIACYDDTAEPDPARNVLKLRKINDRYYILNPSYISFKDPISRINCYDRARYVYIPVPQAIINLCEDISQNRYFFSYQTQLDHYKKLSTQDIDDFLDFANRDRWISTFAFKITRSKITSSFLPFYSQICGLDEIMCTHISGADYHRLYCSQAHYIHIPHDLLEKRYLSAFDYANQQIINNYYPCVKSGMFGHYDFSNTPLIQELSKRDLQHPIAVNLKGYGSSIVMKNNYAIKLMQGLKNKIHNEINLKGRHNLYTCYAYLALELATGLRRRNNPNLKWEHFDHQSNRLTINDKDTSKYHEERTVPLPERISSLLVKIRKGHEKLKRFLSIHYYPSIWSVQQDNIFFLIDSKGHFVDFDLSKLKYIIKSILPDYDLPMNMTRHYFRNHLYHTAICNDAADVFMGHQHSGKEMLNLTSSSLFHDLINIGIPTIDKMLTKLGITDIEYL